MLVNSVVTFPCGPLVIWLTVIFKLGEAQVSEITVISWSLPSAPAGVTRVVRVPRACSPAMLPGGKVSV